MVLALIFLCIAIGCYSIRELHAHGKLRWMNEKDEYSFWGEDCYMRKYTDDMEEPPDNWYYNFFNIGYIEKWPTSATFTVMFTDGPHLMQFFFFLFISLSSGMALELSWKGFILVWLLIHLVHFLVCKLLQK